jgi:sugar lactone lactonase YvrE
MSVPVTNLPVSSFNKALVSTIKIQQEYRTKLPLGGQWSVLKDTALEDKPVLNYFNIIKADESGRIWFASDGKGLTMYDGHSWYNWQPEISSGMKYGAIRSLAVLGNTVYAGGYISRDKDAVMVFDLEQDK